MRVLGSDFSQKHQAPLWLKIFGCFGMLFALLIFALMAVYVGWLFFSYPRNYNGSASYATFVIRFPTSRNKLIAGSVGLTK